MLCKSPLTQDNEHQIKFNNKEDQQTYFNSLTNIYINYNYVRNEGFITVPLNYYEVLKYNYLVFQNTYVNNKWFFCFIQDIVYVNDRTTKIILKTDVFQTYQFDISYHASFVERRHVMTDNLNSMSDNVSSGNLIVSRETIINFTGVYLVFCNADVTHLDLANATIHNFSMGNYQVPCMVLCYKTGQENLLNADLQTLSNMGVGDRINSCVFVPCIDNVEMFNINEIASDITGQTVPVCSGVDNNNIDSFIKSAIEFDFSSLTLTHLKALTSPYAKIIVQDLTTGQQIELEPNKFTNSKATFEIQTSISETPSYRVVPTNYQGQGKSYGDSLVVKCNTTLPLENNTYAKYLMNNQDTNNLKMLGGAVGMIGSVASGSAMGAYSSFESITNVMLQEQQAQRQPNQLSSISDGAMERILLQNGIKIMLMIMDVDHLNTANSYWTMYGYPVKTLESPSPKGLDYEFIKTVGCNITGNFPQDELIEIQNLFNKGVTIWKSNNFRQY